MLSGDLADAQQCTRRFNPRARVSWTVWAHSDGVAVLFLRTIPEGFEAPDIEPDRTRRRVKGHAPSPRQETLESKYQRFMIIYREGLGQ
jgi:hypothetical protein